MSMAALFTTTKAWKQPKYLLTDTWTEKCGVYMGLKWNTAHLEKVGGPAIGKNTNEPVGIMISEISQRKTDTLCSHLYMKSKNLNFKTK